MADLDSTQACVCYQGRYVPYQFYADGFDHEIVNAATFNGRAILDCYAEGSSERNSLLEVEKAKALRALRTNWFYRSADQEKQTEDIAGINQAFTPGQNSSSLAEQDKSTLMGLAAQRGAAIRRCIGKDPEALEAAYQQAALASLSLPSDESSTQGANALKTMLAEIMSGRMSAHYQMYDEGASISDILETSYKNSLLIRKTYASHPDRRDELLTMEKSLAESQLEPIFSSSRDPDRNQSIQNLVHQSLEAIFGINQGKDSTRSVSGYRPHSLNELDARDILRRTLSNGRAIKQIQDSVKHARVLEIEEKTTLALLIIRGQAINEDTAQLVQDFARMHKKAADLPPPDPDAHDDSGDVAGGIFSVLWLDAKINGSMICGATVGVALTAQGHPFKAAEVCTSWWW